MSTIDKILQLVEESGLTAKEYAINAGLGAGNITDWKTGRSKPSVESLQKIAKYANVQLEWLTGDSKFKTKKDEEKHYKYMEAKSIVSQAMLDTLDNFLVLGLTEEQIFKIRDILVPIENMSIKQKEEEIIQFLNTYPKDMRSKIKNAMIDLLNRNTELLQIEESKFLRKEVSQFYMCPVYRSNKCRTT